MRWTLLLPVVIVVSFGCSDAESGSTTKAKKKTNQVADKSDDTADDSNSEDDGADAADATDDKTDSADTQEDDGKDANEEQANAGDPPADFKINGPIGKTNSQPVVSWSASSGAASYDLMIASDAECKTALHEKKGIKGTSVTLEGLDTGNAFVCVTAVGNGKRKATNNAAAVTIIKGWVKISATGAPIGRRFPPTVWTGTKVLIYGGINATTAYESTVVTYDPQSDIWQNLGAGTGAPIPRGFSAMAWANDKAFLWGGYTTSSATPVPGGALDLAANAWAPFAGANPPANRLVHTLVSTGDQIILYGGQTIGASNSGVASGGAIYTPNDDKWEPLETAGNPSPRTGHCAVWTGKEMLVWGGGPDATANNAGFAYDAANKTWRAMSTNGAPSARRFSACVWTGSRMLVFGGTVSESPHLGLSDGGIYDPENDSWSQLPTTAGPSGREAMAAAWTGHAMFVWSGINDNSATSLADGYLYYP